ncbi:DUF1540 domain-containing protein [Paenibacillus sp. GCM10027626]|uniref:DUF1540 domain-containing protein n=1 Tax=Paenibacillus sp. GCM10027626 TaxID=3273411 RepID=UPI00362FEBAE
MPEGVKCSVANCTFWGQGNNCNASSIQIDIDSHSSKQWMNEFAHEEGFGANHQDEAPQSADTCCQTFKPKQ